MLERIVLIVYAIAFVCIDQNSCSAVDVGCESHAVSLLVGSVIIVIVIVVIVIMIIMIMMLLVLMK